MTNFPTISRSLRRLYMSWVDFKLARAQLRLMKAKTDIVTLQIKILRMK